MRMVTTDGHCLSLIERDIGNIGLSKGRVIPRKGSAELKEALVDESEEGTVSLGFAENMGLCCRMMSSSF